MRTSKGSGSILIITLGFMVIFTVFGLSFIHLAGVQNEAAEKQLASLEAFWLADGGIELARKGFPNENMIPQPSQDLNVNVQKIKSNNWIVNSTGTVNNQTREVEANIFAPVSEEIVKNIKKCTTFPTSAKSTLGVSVCIGCENCTFDKIFPGIEIDDVIEKATKYTGGDNLPQLSGISFIYVDKNIKLPISGNGFVIIDTQKEKGQITLDMKDSTFEGIIWISGDAKIQNPPADGALFAYSAIGKVEAIAKVPVEDNVLGETASLVMGQTVIASWKEK